jgi:hypothetical protein
MTDYLPLIARAVEGLERNSGEARRALYERARTALVTQLRSVEPALSETQITKERLALEDAIRKVEADAARKGRAELRDSRSAPALRDRPNSPAPPVPAEPRRSMPSAPKPDADAAGETEGQRPRDVPPSSARERLLGARANPSLSREGIRGFREVVSEVRDLGSATAKAAQSARDARDSYEPMEPSDEAPADEEVAESSAHDFEPQFDAEDRYGPADEEAHRGDHEPSDELEDEEPTAPRFARHPHPVAIAEDEHRQPPRSYRGLVQILVALIILAGVAATVSWQWSNISGLFQHIGQPGSKPPVQTTRTNEQPKFPGRVPKEQSGTPAPGPGTTPGQTAPAVAQRVVLYEEDANDPQGKRSVGSAIWRTETVSPGSGLAPELAVRADIEVPERHMTVTWSLRRNTDKALPATHTIEIMFNVPADFSGGGVANVPGILMKQSEQARGTPLAGLAVKVTNGFFLIGLSAVDTDMARNIELLKDRPWFDIPVVYANGGRAILAMEKGLPGDKAFAEAFAAWEKK